jgi:hypothetical protein
MKGGDEAMATKKTDKPAAGKLVRKPKPKIARVGV